MDARTALRVMLSAILSIGAGGVIVGSTTHVAGAGTPTITATPSTGLADLQKITVAGSGFSANESVAIVQCSPTATGQADCDLTTLSYVTTDSKGAFSAQKAVRRIINVNGGSVDCAAPAGCILGAGNLSLTETAGTKIFFDPNKPPVVPKVTATPNTNLVDHQLVKVAGAGFVPGAGVNVEECALAAPQPGQFPACGSISRFVTVGDSDSFTITSFPVLRILSSFNNNGQPQTIDCASGPGTCGIVVNPGQAGEPHAPLSFNPSVPPVVASLAVTPNGHLADRQPVAVTGRGFVPGTTVYVIECLAGASANGSGCDFSTEKTVTAGFQGQFLLTFPVTRLINASISSSTGPSAQDCASAPGACIIGAEGLFGQQGQTGKAPLSFDPRIPPAGPTITASPSRGLTDNQQVTVTGRGFAPFSPVTIQECTADVVEKGTQYCDFNTALTTQTGTDGQFRAVLFVHHDLANIDGLFSCAAPDACVVAANRSASVYIGGPVVGSSASSTSGAASAVVGSAGSGGSRGPSDSQTRAKTAARFSAAQTDPVRRQFNTAFFPISFAPTADDAGR
jgi:hypothetical protein